MKLYYFMNFSCFTSIFYYDLIKKSLFERVISCEKSTNWFQILKFSKCQKILKNKKIHCLENFETIYIYTQQRNTKRKIGYL